MGTSIKRSIGIRVACAIIGVLLFSVVTTVNIIRIQDTQDAIGQARNVLMCWTMPKQPRPPTINGPRT